MSSQLTEMDFGTRFIESGSLTKITKDPYHIREFETPNGIPDLVLISGSKLESVRAFDRKYAQISSTSGTARVLSLLNRKSYCQVEQLICLTGFSKSYVQKILGDLKRIDAIEKNEFRGVRIAKGFELPSPRIISIEFKLDNWQKALVQASRHSAFASRSYVIMPSGKRELLKRHVNQFVLLGISVGIFNACNNKFEIIWKAPCNYRGKSPRSRVSYLDSLYRMINCLDRLESTAMTPAFV